MVSLPFTSYSFHFLVSVESGFWRASGFRSGTSWVHQPALLFSLFISLTESLSRTV